MKIKKLFYYIGVVLEFFKYAGFKTILVLCGVPVLVKFKGYSLRFCSALDILIFTETVLWDCYKTSDLVKGYVLDLGAAKGDWALWLGARGFEVVAIEANYNRLCELEDNIVASRLRSTVTSVYGFVGVIGSNHYYPQEGESCLVDINQYVTKPVDLLKIDIEGGEFAALKSIAPRNFQRIRRIYLEYHTSELREACRQFLIYNGYYVQVEPNKYDSNIGLMFARYDGL